MQISIFTKLRHGYVIRLTHIFAACNSLEHHAIPKTIPRVEGYAAVDLNCLAAEIHCYKDVKQFFKQLETVSAN